MHRARGDSWRRLQRDGGSRVRPDVAEQLLQRLQPMEPNVQRGWLVRRLDADRPYNDY